MARLAHGLGQRHAAAGRLGQVAGAQAVGRIVRRVEPGEGRARLDDGVDALAVEVGCADRPPQRSIARNTGPDEIPAASSQALRTSTGRPTASTRSSSSRLAVLVRPSRSARTGSFGPSGAPGPASLSLLLSDFNLKRLVS
jgi:hypothetical protein